jgi:hypothetical protein
VTLQVRAYTLAVLTKRSLVAVLFVVAVLSVPARTVAQEPQLYAVTICVHDPSQAPIPNAHVRVIPAPDDVTHETQTDSQGELSLRLRSGGHAVFVSGSGFVSDVQHMDVKPSPEPQRFYSVLSIGSGGGPVVTEDATAAPHVLLAAAPYREPWVLTREQLEAMPRTTVAVQDPSNHEKRNFSGVRMHDLLERAGAPMGKELYGVALRTYVVASGYVPGMRNEVEVVYSLAEFDASNKCEDFVLADTVNGHPISSEEGPFILLSTADTARTRWVPGLKYLMLHP